MGIISLHSYLAKNDVKQKQYVYSLQNKKVCIDVYNFIYKFLARSNLIGDLSKMCKMFHKYNIKALFVFDGKYDKTKIDTQKDRKIKRGKAEEKFQKLTEKKYLSKRERNTLNRVMRERVKVTKWDIFDAKKCLEHCGMKYVVAEGEAEEYCAELVRKNYVFACISDDTDLFPYGCRNIIRNLNIHKETFNLYYLPDILEHLTTTFEDFKIICCLSSNDYNSKSKKKNFMYYNKLYKKYKIEDNGKISFMDWLEYENYINGEEVEKYSYIKDIFDLEKKNIFKNSKYIVIRNGDYNQKAVNVLSVDRENYLAQLYNK